MREPVIELEGVSVAFGDRVVLDGLDLTIHAGETTFIVGRSGSGKTVLLKVMLGLLEPQAGRVRLFGRDLATVSEVELVELRKRMAMLFQNYALFDALSVEDNVEFPLLEGAHVARPDAERLAHQLIRVLGLGGSEQLLPAELSGGMKKRVSLARALVSRPEVVLLDEPTTGLDPIMVEHVDDMIARAKQQYAITSVIVSHDLASAHRLADRIAFLHAGKIAFTGTYDELVHSELPAIRAFFGELAPAATPRETPTSDSPVIELVGVHKSFGDKHVLRGIDLAIYPRRITVLIGASGSGKSVIVKHVMGLMKPDRGKILVFGKDIVALRERELEQLRERFGLVFQHAALLDWMTVAENVAFPLAERHRDPASEVRDRRDAILERLDIAELRDRLPGQISAGERKRVAIARALITRPEILIYDEPTTGQDPMRTREIDDMIVQTQERFDVTTIVVSHDMASTFRIAHAVAMLHRGRIVAYGSPAELSASANEHVQHFLRAAHG
ncbi:MAG TPA: ATP-binding cassette domain-containing protein [Kofleriaceae bacterium]|nr:ATP-binding cassette domain-containing protein [Kofleriaceae bacterium]